LDVTEGRLVIGFRFGECMEDPDKAALSVFNTVYGAGVTSKLFVNVRERLQLCYYASSSADSHKGLLFASAGIDFDRFDEAKDEMLHQLDEIRNGNITDEEMEYAKKGICSDLKSMQDSQAAMESYTITNILDGWMVTPEEYIELVNAVTKEDVIAVANSTVCDLIYFLRGEEDAAQETAEDIKEFENNEDDSCRS
ncbi:MAG: insulinase family protein, partial [Clostridia bacterium]|nr:insulinase family protein [Clostridia bacterium]